MKEIYIHINLPSWDLSRWNKDPNNPRLIRVQDKGFCFVVDFEDSYEQKVNEYVGDPSTFRSDEEDLSLEHGTCWVERASNLTFSKCLHLVDLNNPQIFMTHDKMAVTANIRA